jgi:lactoylglutathione lyase
MPARLVGINHVAIEVAWYRRFFEFELRGRIGDSMAFVDMGDQFIALARHPSRPPDAERHFGLVVDDKDAVRAALTEAGIEVTRAPDLSFRDPWGNHVQVVGYRDIQFTKTPEVLHGMGLDGLEKSESALAELREAGLTD